MCELPSLICALEHCHEAKEFLFAASHGFSWMGKVMLSCFWDGDGIIMTDYLEQGHTITGNYYSALLAKLRSTLATKSRGKLQKGILLLHDNAPAHRSMMAVHTSMQCGFKILLHPPYSPDLAPSDFFRVFIYIYIFIHTGVFIYI